MTGKKHDEDVKSLNEPTAQAVPDLSSPPSINEPGIPIPNPPPSKSADQPKAAPPKPDAALGDHHHAADPDELEDEIEQAEDEGEVSHRHRRKHK